MAFSTPPEMGALCAQLSDHMLSPAEFVERCLRLVAETVESRGAALCVLLGEQPRRVMRCLRAYDRATDSFMSMSDDSEEHIAAFFAALDGDGRVVVPDADDDPHARTVTDGTGRRVRITSYMAAAFSFNGRVFGAWACFDFDRRVDWSPQQLVAMSKLANAATLALARENGGRMAEAISRLMSATEGV